MRSRNSERGQVLIIIVAAMVGLIGMVGLAVDGGMAFSDRRHAQNAADTAALAGSLARINEELNWRSVAWGVADENGYDGLLSNDVDVYLCSEESASCDLSAGANPDDYVQVIITSWFDTYFARIVGIPTVTNRVEAIALSDTDDTGPLANGEAIVALRQDCKEPASFIVQGTPNLNVEGGGLWINSDDPACGFKCDTSSGTITGNITIVGGGFEPSAHCEENGINGTVTSVASPIDYPITLDDIGLDVPPECDTSDPSLKGAYTNYPAGTTYESVTYSEPITVLTPGWYTDFPPKKEQPLGALNDTIVMQPGGMYCVGNVIRWNVPNFKLIGHNITLFVRAGYDFSFTGGDIVIDAPDTGDYAGYAIIVEPDYTFTNGVLDSPDEACTINGDADNSYTGTIFAPYCVCTLNGGSEPTGFNAQLLCYEVKITGDSIINFTYDPGENGRQIDPPKIGITK